MSAVAPYVGAWIETDVLKWKMGAITSHPTWVRGLKLGNSCSCIALSVSHPTWVRGLKLVA